MRRVILLLIFISGLISIDSFSKYYVVSTDSGKYVSIFWEYLWLQLSYNHGIAFSLPITGLPLQILTILIIIGLFFYYTRYEYPKNSRYIDMGFGLIFSGALSHAYERIFLGYVVDFISVKYFAILNFADIFISVWGFLLLLIYINEEINQKRKNSLL